MICLHYKERRAFVLRLHMERDYLGNDKATGHSEGADEIAETVAPRFSHGQLGACGIRKAGIGVGGVLATTAESLTKLRERHTVRQTCEHDALAEVLQHERQGRGRVRHCVRALWK